MLSEEREAEANADDRDQRGLGPIHPHYESHHRWHDDKSDADECDQEQDQGAGFQRGIGERDARLGTALRHRRCPALAFVQHRLTRQ